MDKENSHYFHSEEKGCKIKNKKFNEIHYESKSIIKGAYCLTHKKDLCRCGWEWGWHGGTDSSRADEEV
jgi:hypothetical protein